MTVDPHGWWRAARIESERLFVRAPLQEDFEAWGAAHRAAAPPRSDFDQPPRAPEACGADDFEALLGRIEARAADDRGYVFWMFHRDERRWLGTLWVFDVIRSAQQNAFLGFHVWNHEWGQGFASEALRALVPAVFAGLGLHRLEAVTEPANRASQRVARRAGLRFEYAAKRRIHQRGAWRDTLHFAITAEEIARP